MEWVQEFAPWTKPFFAMQVPLWLVLVIAVLALIANFIFKHRLIPYVSQLSKNKADLTTISEKTRLAEKEKRRVQNESDAYQKIYNATLKLDGVLRDPMIAMHMASGCGDSQDERGAFMLKLDYEVIGKWAADVSEAFGVLDDEELSMMVQHMESAAKKVTEICNPLKYLIKKDASDEEREKVGMKRIEEHLEAGKEWKLIVDSVLDYVKRKSKE